MKWIGYEDHVHDYAWEVISQSTCEETGRVRYFCRECEEEYFVETHALGHTIEMDMKIAATCNENGLSEGSHCSKCGEVITAQEIIPATGHTAVEDAAVEPTCTATGLKAGSHCSVCGEILTVQETVPALGHNFGDWVVTKVATEEEEGQKDRTCERCGETETSVIGKLAHTHTVVTDAEVTPTCTESGLTAGSHCSKCGEVITAQEIIPAIGHKAVEDAAVAPTCTATGLKAGSHCSVCGEILKAQEVVPAQGHAWGTPIYTWGKDNLIVTATRMCLNDHSHKETETVNTVSEVTMAATYTTKGQTTYTAIFINPPFASQTKAVTNIAKLTKKDNTLTASGKKVTIKLSKLKKKTQTIKVGKAFTVKNAQGIVTYNVESYDKKAKKKIIVSSAGKVTVKKGLKKGSYKIKVNVIAAGNNEYKAVTKTVTLTIKVK